MIGKRPKSESLRILVVRPDRIGDVILSTPVLEALKRNYPKCHLTLMVREPVVRLVRGLPTVDEVMVYDPKGPFFELVSRIRSGKFRIAVVLQSQWRTSAAVFAAGIRYRIGPISKPHSLLFFNRGVRQRRSHVEMHEADYNLQLLRRLGIRVATRSLPTRVSVQESTSERADAWLRGRGWNPQLPLVAVHPGMGGSALNWPEGHYLELTRQLLKEGTQVLVTSGPLETPLARRLKSELGLLGEKAIFQFEALEELNKDASTLAALLNRASVVVAPSTGPLHVAVALGKPVVTFFPPIRVQSALRWGPYLADESRACIMVPEVFCGEDFKCRGTLCNYFPCMKTLTVNEALDGVRTQLTRNSNENPNPGNRPLPVESPPA